MILWLKTTLLLGFITSVLFVILLFVVISMKKEGRFFTKSNLNNKGVDLIQHEPLSNKLKLRRITWDGERYHNKEEEGLYFGIERAFSPKTNVEKYLNDVVSRMCTWEGSKRPVLMATDTVSFLANPDFMSVLQKAKGNGNYGKFEEFIKDMDLPEGCRKITFLETLKPDDITEYLEDSSPRKMIETFDKGYRAGKRDATKPKEGLGLGGGLAIGLGGLVVIGVIAWILIQSGTVDKFMETVTPNLGAVLWRLMK